MPNCILNDLISCFICPFSFSLTFSNSFLLYHLLQTFIYSFTQSIESVSHLVSTLTVPSEIALCHPFSLFCSIFLLSMCLCQTYSIFICYVTSLFKSSRILCLFLFTALLPITAACLSQMKSSIHICLSECNF